MSKKKYAKAGVDIDGANECVNLIKNQAKRTLTSEVIGGIGGFGGAFKLDLKSLGVKNPVLVSGTDGVGTKLKIAQAMNKHKTIGVDCVAMCVNDIACSGAKPLFFLDYIATDKIKPKQIEKIVAGIAFGCVEAKCALIGGETAEMPGFYPKDEYDVAGFAVGVVDESKMVLTNKQVPGDVLVGIESSGVHSNGFSLIRKVFDIDNNPEILNEKLENLDNTLGEVLLEPTIIYSNVVNAISEKNLSKGFMHITGGGFTENIPRSLKVGLGAKIIKGNLPKLPIFELIQKKSKMSETEMLETFNGGIGMVCVVAQENVKSVVKIISSFNMKSHILGEVTKKKGVSFS